MKKPIILLSVALLTACGFSPMYGQNAATNNVSVKSNLGQIDIAIIPNREGQYLRNLLIDRFYNNGYPTTPQYNLLLSPIKENIIDFDVTLDDEATRRQVRLNTILTLTDTTSNTVILTREVSSITSYNVLESEYSTVVTEQSAREAGLGDIARQVEQQVVLYLNR